MILALDISTSCTGYSLFSEDGALMEINYIKFNSKLSIFEKFADFKKNIEHLLDADIKYIAIEEPLKKFKGKFSSAHTIAILNFFNGMISSFMYNHFGVEPIYYNVNTARSLAFADFKGQGSSDQTKHYVWERVMEMEPQINWKYGPKSRKLLKENYDMCDSYTIGMAHIIIIEKNFYHIIKKILKKYQNKFLEQINIQKIMIIKSLMK
jgi:hypothetical protein